METDNNKNALLEGYLLHWYEIKGVIGSGGFGITYLAHDNNLDRDVAIKEFMPEDFATRDSDHTVHPKTSDKEKLYEWGLEHFIKEAQTLAKFNHPNIVHVQSVFEENNTAYMVMEYAHGEDLSAIYKKRPTFTEEQFLDTFIPVMDGLALVHRAGFIHRDIKPANIFICENNTPILLDFGSARQPIDGKTKALTSLVTYGYAPFEQYSEGTGRQGPWTDIYSLGACMHVGITGQKPVDSLCRGGSFIETGADIYQPLSVAFKGKFSDKFLLAIDNALMFKIDQRPQNIFDWADMLLGKTQAPELPENMLRPPVDDKTVIQTLATTPSSATTGSSRGTQGLVDSRGKRSNEPTSSMQQDRSISISEKSKQLDTSNHANTAFLNRLRFKLPKPGKSWFPIAIASSLIILLLVISTIYLNNSSSPEESKTPQAAQQLKQLLNNAELAYSQKKYVTPDNNNAHYFYQQILKLEANNKTAHEGINEIESQLLILANQNYDEGNLAPAQQYLKQVDIVNPHSAAAKKLSLNIQKQIKNNAQLNYLLNKADNKLSEQKYTTPKDNNAFYYYQQALSLNPGNKAAKKGIEDIENMLFKRASTTYANKQYKESLAYLSQLIAIDPEAKGAISLQNKINKTQTQTSQITSLLSKATIQINNKKYTSPKNNNAFETYNKILKQQPGNKQALEGLQKIQWYYRSQFKRHISASQLGKAERDINIMKNISAPTATIKQMQSTLKRSQQKTIAIEQVDIHHASKIIGQFKKSLESKNKKQLNNLSHYQAGRKQFVDQLFSRYNNISVEVAYLHLIPKENKAKAEIELTNLKDINDKKAIPGNWKKFVIILRYDNKKQLKVYW